MKTRKSILFLLLASVVILSSMSDCVGNIREQFNMNLNDVPYRFSAMNSYPTGGISRPVFLQMDEGFIFKIRRDLESADGQSVNLSLSIVCDEPFELHRQYPFDGQGDSQAELIVPIPDGDGGVLGYFFQNTPGGYVEFTEYDEVCLAGRFEFTAVNSELDSVIYVTSGTFDDVDVVRFY